MQSKIIQLYLKGKDFNEWKERMIKNDEESFFIKYLAQKFPSPIEEGREEIYSSLLTLAIMGDDFEAVDILLDKSYSYNILTNSINEEDGPLYSALFRRNINLDNNEALYKIYQYLQKNTFPPIEAIETHINLITELLKFSRTPASDLEDFIEPLFDNTSYEKIVNNLGGIDNIMDINY